MTNETLEKAIGIKRAIAEIDGELERLPSETHKRRLRWVDKFKKQSSGMIVVETYYYDGCCIEMTKEDIQALIEIRIKKREELRKKLEELK